MVRFSLLGNACRRWTWSRVRVSYWGCPRVGFPFLYRQYHCPLGRFCSLHLMTRSYGATIGDLGYLSAVVAVCDATRIVGMWVGRGLVVWLLGCFPRAYGGVDLWYLRQISNNTNRLLPWPHYYLANKSNYSIDTDSTYVHSSYYMAEKFFLMYSFFSSSFRGNCC